MRGALENPGNLKKRRTDDGEPTNIDQAQFDGEANQPKKTYIDLLIIDDEDARDEDLLKFQFDITWQEAQDLILGCEKVQGQFDELYKRHWIPFLDEHVEKVRKAHTLTQQLLLQQVQAATRSLQGGEDYIQRKYLESGDLTHPQRWMYWHASYVESLQVEDPMADFLTGVAIPGELKIFFNEIEYEFEDMADVWDSWKLESVFNYFLNNDNVEYLKENAKEYFLYPSNVDLFSPGAVGTGIPDMENGTPPGITNIADLIEAHPELHVNHKPWQIQMAFWQDSWNVPQLNINIQDYYASLRKRGIENFFHQQRSRNMPKRFVAHMYSRILKTTREQEQMQLVMRSKDMPWVVEDNLIQFGKGRTGRKSLIHSRLPASFASSN